MGSIGENGGIWHPERIINMEIKKRKIAIYRKKLLFMKKIIYPIIHKISAGIMPSSRAFLLKQ